MPNYNGPKLNGTFSTLALAAGLSAGICSAILTDGFENTRGLMSDFVGTRAFAEDKVEAPAPQWAASATGRIEPRSGAIAIAPQVAGRIEKVVVSTNDQVKEGDLLVQIADEDARDRITVARAEERVRRGERSEEPVEGLAKKRQEAEDAVFDAEQDAFDAWMTFDETFVAANEGGASEAEVRQARDRIRSLEAKISAAKSELERIKADPDLPAPGRLESGLTIARAELALAQNAFKRTRVRAPFDGTVLNVFAHVGETAVPTSGGPLLKFGDLANLRVRAEVEERDVAKVRIGQKVVVRADAFPDREFEGVVTEIASALGSPRITSRGPRRPNDVDVLEVVADLDGSPPLLTGMRVDVFFKPIGRNKQSSAAGN